MPDLLRICTAGTVDDGKSTLIGRLLYDSKAVYEDQLQAVKTASSTRGVGPIDFSLFTDGLRAEREQGITIDVAYRYFSTPRRTFILADTPGHEQYTRNTATGASTADVVVLLVDARHGVRTQTRRHARIARLLGISTFVVAVNKMDLIGFDRGVFERIRDELVRLIPGATVQAIPVSALLGDNVIVRSDRTPWFNGPSLLEFLEAVDVPHRAAARPFRFPVQLVVRSDHEFRGYAGQVVSGTVRVGDTVSSWPSGHAARVRRIVTWDGDLGEAFAPMSVTLVLDKDVDVGRGDIIAAGPVQVATRFKAELVWMDERPADRSRVYLLKQASRTVAAEIDRPLALNEIDVVSVITARPIAFDEYADDRSTGSFILIDPATNFTVGAGMIADTAGEHAAAATHLSAAERIAALARAATTDADAVQAVRDALQEMLV